LLCRRNFRIGSPCHKLNRLVERLHVQNSETQPKLLSVYCAQNQFA
jgi:hypothetical protein